VGDSYLDIKDTFSKNFITSTSQTHGLSDLEGTNGCETRFFFSRGTFSVEDGIATHFWEDSWLGETPLATQYASL
jgi:hypothetical protein